MTENTSTIHQNGKLFDIEKYSGEVQSIMTAAPGWLISRGSMAILLMLAMIFLASFYISYPDVVKSEFVLGSATPSVKIFARETGRLNLFVKDKDTVKAGNILGVITNTASYPDITYFMSVRDSIRLHLLNGQYQHIRLRNNVNLGELQSFYVTFYNLLDNYNTYTRLRKMDNYLVNIADKKKLQAKILENLKSADKILQFQYQLGQSRFERDSLLYKQNATSKQEFENAKYNLLPLELNIENSKQSQHSIEMQKLELESRKLEITYQEEQYISDLKSRLVLTFNELDKSFLIWKERYLLTAPIDGIVTLFGVWSNDQTVMTQQEVMNISHPDNSPFGYASLPAERSGKVKEGQKVLISFFNYPENEYGLVKGYVKSISLLPKENQYYLNIGLQDSLKTDFGKNLVYKEQMTGVASIITEDLTLIDRFLYNFRKMTKLKE